MASNSNCKTWITKVQSYAHILDFNFGHVICINDITKSLYELNVPTSETTSYITWFPQHFSYFLMNDLKIGSCFTCKRNTQGINNSFLVTKTWFYSVNYYIPLEQEVHHHLIKSSLQIPILNFNPKPNFQRENSKQFRPIVNIYIPWKRRKTNTFSGGIEIEHSLKMG